MSDNKEIQEEVGKENETSSVHGEETVAAEDAKAGENEAGFDQLKVALQKAEAKAEENYNLALRTKAELENSKRRMEKDVANAHKFSIEKFAQELLPVIDSLEMGLAAASDEAATLEKFREGSEMTINMFVSALEKSGVEVTNPEGEKFNPDLHQAMSMQEDANSEPNTVLTVIQKGYTIHGRLMRPAMVIVSRAPSEPKNNQIDETA